MICRTAERVIFSALLAVSIVASASSGRCGFAGQEAPVALDELRLGLGAMEKGEFESALGHYGRALESAGVDELRFQAHLGMGSAYAATDRLDDAADAYRAALEIRPGHAAAMYSLGLVTKDQGRYEEAAQLFASAAVRDPGFGEALVELGIVYEHLGRHGDAVNGCRRAVTALEDDEAALLCIAVANFHMGKYSEAIGIFESVVESNPANARARYGLGLAKLSNGDRDGAIAEVGKMNKLNPELANLLYEKIFPPE